MKVEESKPLTQKQIFSGVQICKELKAKERCFRLQQYTEGKFRELFHEHVPKHRISQGQAIEVMKALIVHYSKLSSPQILRSYLNDRSKVPVANKLFRVEIDYPESGVTRKYCSAGDINAWIDEVVAPNEFRCSFDSNPRDET